MEPPAGIEPASTDYKTVALPLSYSGMCGFPFARALSSFVRDTAPLTQTGRDPAIWRRTVDTNHNCMAVNRFSKPFPLLAGLFCI